jgi:UDP-N-acetylmuramate dehydrogenase
MWTDALPAVLRDKLKRNEALARYTAARLGGPADYLAVAETTADLAAFACAAWDAHLPLVILGGGSNVLVSDAGVRGLVIENRAQAIEFRETPEGLRVWAEAGVNLGMLARQCVARGWAGLEWAATIPGTVGGAVYGNAGAHGSDVAAHLIRAEVLPQHGRARWWSRDELQLAYRTSALKQKKARGGQFVILSAEFALTRSTPAELQTRVEQLVAHRKRAQPPGASLGSMFKNPPGDYAGRLIEAAGLKGARRGNVEISPIHANFFINIGAARAADVFALIQLAHDTVWQKFGVDLELEVELVGAWPGKC